MSKTIEVLLEENKSQLMAFQGGEYDITAVGYNLLNKFTEISLLEPNKITYEGKDVENPYIVKNEKGEIDTTIYKCYAAGYGPQGNIVITSSTLNYNPDLYLLKDLMEIVSIDDKAGKITKECLLSDEDKIKGFYVPFKNDLIVYVSLNHPDVIRAFNNYALNKTYGERTVQTLCKRNALKQHPALSNLLETVEGEEGYKKAKVKLTLSENLNLTKEKLIELTEGYENIKILDDNVEYKETELLTSDQMLGLNLEAEIKEKENLLNEIKEMDREKRDTAFKRYFKNCKKFSDLTNNELKYLIRVCIE